LHFSELLESNEIILLDGAIGTELDKCGLMGRASSNLDAPEAVLEIQREYAACGCDALTTNTLTMNRIFIESHNLSISVRDVNIAGAELARQAAGKERYVLGNLSSTGQLLEPYGNYNRAQFYDAFREQAGILAESGVDGFIIETMLDLREAICALGACKENFSLPVSSKYFSNFSARYFGSSDSPLPELMRRTTFLNRFSSFEAASYIPLPGNPTSSREMITLGSFIMAI